MKRLTASRVAYFNGQLLDATDFRADQDYHRNARLLHNLKFHSWGVVDGLAVSRHGDREISVAPGLAVDSLGREIQLDEPAVMDLSAFEANQTIYITLAYEEDPGEPRESAHGAGPSRVREYAVLAASTADGSGASVTLASIRLDSKARLDEGAIGYGNTRYASSVLAPGAVGYRQLAEGLRSGWVRLPFKPIPLEDRPAFRVGPTEARSTDDGAAGSLAIPVPPGVTEIRQFRIAGELNEGVIKVEMFRCGWDPKSEDHEKTAMLTRELKASSKKAQGSFEHTEPVNGELDAEYHALSMVITATKKTSISLIAVEFSYPGIGTTLAR